MNTPHTEPDSLHRIRVTVNGRTEDLRVSPRRTLLHTLREDLHLTGAKEGCGVGTCGACTVLLDGRAVLSCLLLAVQAEGRTVDTVEGAGDGALDRLQQAFIRHDALQCGFCTPGQIMALRGLLRQLPHPSARQIRQALEGNICRCGAYPRIQTAALEAAQSADSAGRTSDDSSGRGGV